MQILNSYINIKKEIETLNSKTNFIVVSKNQKLEKIQAIINNKHIHFGENRVQEAILKWGDLISVNSNLKLHLVGKLQSNKAKDAFKIFHYIHTLDNEKLAQILSKLEGNLLKKIKYFIQVNIGNEPQKSGIPIEKVSKFIEYCINDLNLNIIGLMCIPPADCDPGKYFINLAKIARQHKLKELSMGMSSDYECAIQNGATFVRIGTKIFSSD